MKNYEQLKIAIAEVIKNNGNREITGDVLQDVLLGIVSTLGNHATYAGIATPALNPDIADANVFFLTSTPGEYQFFGGIIVDENEIVALVHDNDVWTKQTINVSVPFNYNVTYAQLVELRDNAQLVPGAKYCINDYVATVVKESFSVMPDGITMHIVVTAIDASRISEDAIAYVPDENFGMEAIFDVSYSLDNDTYRFDWADVENGKGVIYRMVDYLNNEMPFDFVNIFILGGPAFVVPYPNYLTNNPKNHKVFPVYNGRQMILREVRVAPWNTQGNIIKGSVIKGGIITGNNNYVGYGSTVLIIGSNNHIDDNCNNITLQNSNNNKIVDSNAISLTNSENNVFQSSPGWKGTFQLCQFHGAIATDPEAILNNCIGCYFENLVGIVGSPGKVESCKFIGPITVSFRDNVNYSKATFVDRIGVGETVIVDPIATALLPIDFCVYDNNKVLGVKDVVFYPIVQHLDEFYKPITAHLTEEEFEYIFGVSRNVIYAPFNSPESFRIWLPNDNLNINAYREDGWPCLLISNTRVNTSIELVNLFKKQWIIRYRGGDNLNVNYDIVPLSNVLKINSFPSGEYNENELSDLGVQKEHIVALVNGKYNAIYQVDDNITFRLLSFHASDNKAIYVSEIVSDGTIILQNLLYIEIREISREGILVYFNDVVE